MLQDDKRELPAKQLLLHKRKEVAFCYEPKSVCTTFKILPTSLPRNASQSISGLRQTQPHVAPKLHKILLKALDSQEQESIVRNYFKFVMLRHPLERLLGGYRHKMSVAVKSEEKMTDDNDRDVEGDILLVDRAINIKYIS